MSWGKGGGGWQGGGGPWGRPTGGGGNQGGGNDRRPPERNQPDMDEWLQRMQDKLRDFFSDGNGARGWGLVVLAVGVLWLASGFYVVGTSEQGVVMRFGAFHRVTEPGLRYHLPAPIEAVETPSVTSSNTVEIGFRSGGGGNYIPEESLMLTGDENIVDINFSVQWKIRNADQYLFNVRNPREAVKAVAESAMREVVGRTPIANVLTLGRSEAEGATKKLIQATLDQYGAGIEIIKVNMLKVDPPGAVIDAFRDVQTARADRERARNEAEAYRNDITPRARGQAEQMLQEAEAYKQEVVARAQGEANRFSAVYKEYKAAPDVTKKRMYLETMEQILSGMNKIVIDPRASGGVVPYLPLPELKRNAAQEGANNAQ